MATSTFSEGPLGSSAPVSADAFSAGLSWGAILAGAAAAAALSLILMVLGFGLGLSAVSPWGARGAGAVTIGVSTILWLTFTQLAASGLGGYLAGRLRQRWATLHGDEVYFRDTAHGFLAWAIATLITAALLSGTIMAALGGAVRAGTSVAQSAVQTASVAASQRSASASSDTMSYYVDSLFRSEQPVVTQLDPASRTEVAKIFAMDVRQGALPDDDRRYVGQLIARQTGLAQPDAEKRVSDTFARVTSTLNHAETKARETADAARKAAAYAALWLFIALLAGAFFASVAALFGGRQRDAV